MAHSDTTGAPVTVDVPARCTQRLYREALDNLVMAGENVAEGAQWLRERIDEERLDARDLPRMREVDLVWGQIREVEGNIAISAPADVLAPLLRSCVRSLTDDLSTSAEEQRTSCDSVRAMARELLAWTDVFDAAGLTIGGSR